MSIFRELAHLEEQLGPERFAALISSENTGMVKDFCDQLLKDALPIEMTIGGITYDILGFLREDETSVPGDVMVARAEEMNANLGQEDCDHLLAHQNEIPVALRGKVAFIFTGWRRPVDRGYVASVEWDGVRWIKSWSWLVRGWYGFGRLLRRK